MFNAIRLSLSGLALAAVIGTGASVVPLSPAKAVVYCAAGRYHAGCVHRRLVRPLVVAPAARCHWVAVNGVRVHRCH